jgi:hypothetical protein
MGFIRPSHWAQRAGRIIFRLNRDGTVPPRPARGEGAMLRTTIIASAAILAIGTAQAQSALPVLHGGGDDRTLTYDGAASPRGNLVGGGVATIAGGGDNRVISYRDTVAAETGLVASVTGGGDNRVITYAPVGAAASVLAGPALPGQRG